MTFITAQNRTFLIEFRHIRRKLARHPSLAGITVCTIVVVATLVPDGDDVQFTATGLALCSASDNFCRKTGRRVAFHKAVMGCGALRGYASDLLAAYNRLDPPPPVKRGNFIPTTEEWAEINAKGNAVVAMKQQRWADGAETRLRRAAERAKRAEGRSV